MHVLEQHKAQTSGEGLILVLCFETNIKRQEASESRDGIKIMVLIKCNCKL